MPVPPGAHPSSPDGVTTTCVGVPPLLSVLRHQPHQGKDTVRHTEPRSKQTKRYGTTIVTRGTLTAAKLLQSAAAGGGDDGERRKLHGCAVRLRHGAAKA